LIQYVRDGLLLRPKRLVIDQSYLVGYLCSANSPSLTP